MECQHNQRSRSTSGFYYKDCDTFFSRDSPTYRSDELLSSIWMVLHNINVGRYREGENDIPEVSAMKNKIGIGVRHDNYEELISEAELIMARHGKNSRSATITLGD